jgi:hypothetical protein
VSRLPTFALPPAAYLPRARSGSVGFLGFPEGFRCRAAGAAEAFLATKLPPLGSPGRIEASTTRPGEKPPPGGPPGPSPAPTAHCPAVPGSRLGSRRDGVDAVAGTAGDGRGSLARERARWAGQTGRGLRQRNPPCCFPCASHGLSFDRSAFSTAWKIWWARLRLNQ